MPFFSLQDEKTVFDFLGEEYERYYALKSIILRQNFMLSQKALKREDKTNEFIKKIIEVPENLKLWINNILDSNKGYIFMKNNIDSNMVSCFCSCCKQESYFEKVSLDYNKMICPVCHEEQSIKNVYNNKVVEYKTIFYMQRDTENEIIIRIFKLKLIIKDNWNIKYDLEEFYRLYISFDKNKNIQMINYRTNYYKKWEKSREEFIRIYRECYLYTKNLNQVLEGTPYQFSSLLEAAIHINNLNPINYLKIYVEHPYIEYLVKLKFYKLIEIILTERIPLNLNPNGKTITEVLKLPKQWIKLAQKLNVDNDKLEIIQIVASNPIKTITKISSNNSKKEIAVYISEETINWFFSNYKSKFNLVNTFSVFMEILKCVPQKKAIRYIREQSNIKTKTNLILSEDILRNIIQDWRDYLNFYRDLNINLKSTFTSMPKNLFESHNAIMKYSLDNKNFFIIT